MSDHVNHRRQQRPYLCRATQTTIRWDLLLPGEPAGFDVELQEYLPNGAFTRRFRFGRVGVTDTKGETVWDVYFNYDEDEDSQKFVPPPRFNVKFQDLKLINGAIPGRDGEKMLKELFKGRTVVVHDEKAEKGSWFFETDILSEANDIHWVDTQKLYSGEVRGRSKPSLRDCAQDVLGREIQDKNHLPVEDALATMDLYLNKFPYDRDAEEAKHLAQRLDADFPTLSQARTKSHSNQQSGAQSRQPLQREAQPQSATPRPSDKGCAPSIAYGQPASLEGCFVIKPSKKKGKGQGKQGGGVKGHKGDKGNKEDKENRPEM